MPPPEEPPDEPAAVGIDTEQPLITSVTASATALIRYFLGIKSFRPAGFIVLPP
jgi:hypothetical protein